MPESGNDIFELSGPPGLKATEAHPYLLRSPSRAFWRGCPARWIIRKSCQPSAKTPDKAAQIKGRQLAGT